MKISEGGRGRGDPFERMDHPPRATTELFFTPSRDYRSFLAFWKLYFSSQKQSHLVKFGWKFNLDYKNNVLAT